jgi:hypothetical protein
VRRRYEREEGRRGEKREEKREGIIYVVRK